MITPEFGLLNFTTGQTSQNPIRLPGRQTDEHGFVDAEVNNTRGWLVDRNTTHLRNLVDGTWVPWRPALFEAFNNEYFDQRVYSGEWASHPNGRHRIPWQHDGRYAGTPGGSYSNGYPYTCFFARWCFYGHNQERPEWGAFQHHSELWPYQTVTYDVSTTYPWVFTPCPTNVCVHRNNTIVVDGPVAELQGFRFGQVRLNGEQRIRLQTMALRCTNTAGQSVAAPNCGVQPPSESLLRNIGAGPRTYTWGPFVTAVELTSWEVTPPAGFTRGSNPRTNAYEVITPNNLRTVDNPPSNGRVQFDEVVRFFQPTRAGEFYTVTATVEISFNTKSQRWNGSEFNPVRDNPTQTREATIECRGFSPATGQAADCQFSVVGSVLN